jgi:hypothetical protein
MKAPTNTVSDKPSRSSPAINSGDASWLAIGVLRNSRNMHMNAESGPMFQSTRDLPRPLSSSPALCVSGRTVSRTSRPFLVKPAKGRYGAFPEPSAIGPVFARSSRLEPTLSGHTRPRPWTPQLGGKRAYRGGAGNSRNRPRPGIRHYAVSPHLRPKRRFQHCSVDRAMRRASLLAWAGCAVIHPLAECQHEVVMAYRGRRPRLAARPLAGIP